MECWHIPVTVNRSGVNWTYAYNELSLPTSATLALDGRTYAQSYDYSLAAALTNYTLPSGKAVVQGVDGLGRVASVSVDSTNIASGFAYHPNGSVAGVTYGNGQVFSQTLTPRQQTDRLRSVKGAELPVDLTYTYTPRSQIASVNDQTVPNIDQAFTYDGIGRLTASTGPWGNGTFQYDGLGNIRQRQVGTRTVGMSYNAANQLSAHTDTALAVPAPVSMSALYDGASRRVKQVAAGVTRYSVYDASGTLIEIDEVGGAKTDYIRASGMTLARIVGSTVTWLHHDHLGSAVAGTNASGAVVWRESEQPFGEDWTTAAANDNQAGYTGHVEDAATGLVYMQARYYDPVIGRFLSIDPVGYSPGRPSMFNRYAYAGNDPVNMVDPKGMDYECRPNTSPSGVMSCRGPGDVSLQGGTNPWLDKMFEREESGEAAEGRRSDEGDFGNPEFYGGAEQEHYKAALAHMAGVHDNNDAGIEVLKAVLIAGPGSKLRAANVASRLLTKEGALRTSATVAKQLAGERSYIPTQAILETVRLGDRVADPQGVAGRFMYRSQATRTATNSVGETRSSSGTLEVLVNETDGLVEHVLFTTNR